MYFDWKACPIDENILRNNISKSESPKAKLSTEPFYGPKKDDVTWGLGKIFMECGSMLLDNGVEIKMRFIPQMLVVLNGNRLFVTHCHLFYDKRLWKVDFHDAMPLVNGRRPKDNTKTFQISF